MICLPVGLRFCENGDNRLISGVFAFLKVVFLFFVKKNFCGKY